MNCEDVTNDILADRADGTLEASVLAGLETHLEVCPDCASRARSLASVLGKLGDWPEEKPLPTRVDGEMAAFIGDLAAERCAHAVPAKPPLRWTQALVPAAAAVLLAVTGYVAGALGGLPGGSPHEPVSSADPARLDAEARERRRLEGALAQVRIEVEESRIERERLKHKLEGSEEAAATSAAVIDSLEKTIEALTARCDAENEKAESLRTEAQATAGKFRNLEGLLSDAKGRIEECLSRVKALEREKGELEARLGEAEERVAQVSREKEDLNGLKALTGDWNGDGRADLGDSRAICAALAGGGNVDFVPAADLNDDGRIDMGDALLIARSALGGQ
jgi:hypothetical protein